MITVFVDAAGGTLGRVASFAAKQALLGKDVKVLNCNDILVSGRPKSTVKEYDVSRKRHSSSLKGPNFPKDPMRVVKRTVRGMLPYKRARGADALKKVICYNTTPKEFEDSEKISLAKELNVKSISLRELARKL